MASESYFTTKFCVEIANEWKGKLSETKARIIWASLKTYPDEVLQSGLAKILRETNFPGIDKIIEYCAQEMHQYNISQRAQVRDSHSCDTCGGQGMRQAGNFAYRCHCKLGGMLFPGLPVYEGQFSGKDKEPYRNSEGHLVRETDDYIYICKKDNSKNIRDYAFVVKKGSFTYKAHPKNTQFSQQLRVPVIDKANAENF